MTLFPSAYVADMVLSELEDIVGQEYVSTREVDRLAYGVDYCWIPRVWFDRGMKPIAPDVIVRPKNTEEVSAVIRVANRYEIPVVTWGGGSGSQGGALPIRQGITLDTKRMNQIVEVNETALTVTAGTGIIQQHLEWALNARGYSMMHYPASIACATLGGFLAHRGTGVLSTKYGKIEDMVVSMEVVLPNGDIIRTLPVPRHASGPDLNQLFIGSEGTLGVITEATMKIHRPPEAQLFRAFMFKDLHSGLEAGRKLMAARLRPSALRLYDEPETKKQVRRVLGIEKEGCYLVYSFDGAKRIAEIEEEMAREICAETATEDLGSEPGRKWWEHRYDFYYPPHMYDLPQMFGTMDTVATYDKIEQVYWAMKEAVETQFPGVTFIAHFSHWYDWGCMCYDRFILDSPPEDPHEALRLHNAIWNAGVRAAIANGGIINEHHGVGLKLARFMTEQYGSAFQVFEGIKKALDPRGIMNPGKLGL
ncbi:MAG: FAD-binding oxidoreductase [Firmicutes bacterium]|jgi:alkyldihydroxyacetonephosphate synthase|nr:FAD-binding oxidoreductase [Bacillota bacterium]